MNLVYENGSKCRKTLILGQTFLGPGPEPGVRDSQRTEHPPRVRTGRWWHTQNNPQKHQKAGTKGKDKKMSREHEI